MQYCRRVLLPLMLISFIGCTTHLLRRPAADGTGGQSGSLGAQGQDGATGGLDLKMYYAQNPFASHYMFAIEGGDQQKLSDWIEAGYSAEYRSCERCPSAVEQALISRNVLAFKMLAENKDATKRPDPRQKIDICAKRGKEVLISRFDYVVFGRSVSAMTQAGCNDEKIYLEALEKQKKSLHLSYDSSSLFMILANLESNRRYLREEIGSILEALKTSPYRDEGSVEDVVYKAYSK